MCFNFALGFSFKSCMALETFSSWLSYLSAFLFRLRGMVVVVMLGRMVGQVVVSRVGNSYAMGNRRAADVIG